MCLFGNNNGGCEWIWILIIIFWYAAAERTTLTTVVAATTAFAANKFKKAPFIKGVFYLLFCL